MQGFITRSFANNHISYWPDLDHLRISISTLSLHTFQFHQLLFQRLVLRFKLLPLAPDLSSTHVSGCLTQSIEKKRAVIYHEVYDDKNEHCV